MWVLRKFWAIISLFLVGLGIFYAPDDISNWQDATGPWQKGLAMLHQPELAWIIIVLLLAWFAWKEIKPFVERFISPQDVEFSGIRIISKPCRNQDENIYENQYYAVFRNCSNKKKTLYEIKIKIHSFFKEYEPEVFGLGDDKSLHHADSLNCYIGSYCSKEILGTPAGFEEHMVSDDYIKYAVTNLAMDHHVFMVKNRSFLGAISGKSYTNEDNIIVVDIYLKDSPSYRYFFAIKYDGTRIFLHHMEGKDLKLRLLSEDVRRKMR
ncbi:hypothetical protein [Amaricoccus macauensis]|uniref:hypothetical protein n=1 Tax=Amaricoccus macauensis TaxID=57001 RepID=UPI003C7ED5C9